MRKIIIAFLCLSLMFLPLVTFAKKSPEEKGEKLIYPQIDFWQGMYFKIGEDEKQYWIHDEEFQALIDKTEKGKALLNEFYKKETIGNILGLSSMGIIILGAVIGVAQIEKDPVTEEYDYKNGQIYLWTGFGLGLAAAIAADVVVSAGYNGLYKAANEYNKMIINKDQSSVDRTYCLVKNIQF